MMRKPNPIPPRYQNWRYLTQREVRLCRARNVAATRTWITYRDGGGTIMVGKRVRGPVIFGCEIQRAPYLG